MWDIIISFIISLIGILEAFQSNNALLEQILKCLEAYLESKRVIFPRWVSLFYHLNVL